MQLAEENAEYNGKNLRLYIEGKGCDGFYYGVAFDEKSADDAEACSVGESLTLIIDPDSATFCKNVTIDWIDDERGQGFLVENHDQKKFKGKFYKRQAWQKKLTENRT